MYKKKRHFNLTQNTRKYKQMYYENNIELYKQRNKEAAEKLTTERLEAFVTDEILFKLTFILRPENIDLW